MENEKQNNKGIKQNLFNEIEIIKDNCGIKSIDDRFFKRDNRINFSFNCKYHNLKRKYQDYFLSSLINDSISFDYFNEDYPQFLEELFKNKRYKNLQIDLKNCGFYGRSDGNFCISFVDLNIDNCYINDNSIKDLRIALKDINNMVNIVLLFKKYMFNWFNKEIAFRLKEEKQQQKDEKQKEILLKKIPKIIKGLKENKYLISEVF